MLLSKTEIAFRYSKPDRKLFDPKQKEHFRSIEKYYKKLRASCIIRVELPQSGTHKEWIGSRVSMHVNGSILRLLYLTEAFCDAAKKFNGPACATLIKGMVEIPLHLGYIVWVISENQDFEIIRTELNKLAWGNRDATTGLTSTINVKHKDLYQKADSMIRKHFKESPSSINVFEQLYKEANAIGHHNYEARMLTGFQKGEVWEAGDRKELFSFLSNKIFQVFLFCDTALGMSSIFLNAIDHYKKQMPDYLGSVPGTKGTGSAPSHS